jgi:hypothetical protein
MLVFYNNWLVTLQVISISLSAVATFMWVRWALLNRPIWRYSLLPLSWLANVFLFYFLRLVVYNDITLELELTMTFNLWSNVIRIQGLIVLIVAAYVMIATRKYRISDGEINEAFEIVAGRIERGES